METSVKQESNYPEIVTQIHKEFSEAARDTLKKLEPKDVNCDKGQRLMNVGFRGTREALDAMYAEANVRVYKEMKNLVDKYAREYPLHKFINESSVKTICHKYGLIMGNISMFSGFVPENKLKQIEEFVASFSLKMKGKFYTISTGEYQFEGSAHRYDLFDGTSRDMFLPIQFVPMGIEEREYVPKLKICAPRKDMNIPFTHEINDYKIESKPDPVVLQPVEGGYLIVAAWGDEASDPEVVNSINQ